MTDKKEYVFQMHITESAKSEIQRFYKEELQVGEFVRIARAYQCGGSRFQILVDDVTTPMDRSVQFEEFAIVIDGSCEALLDDCELDFHESGFIFIDDLGNVC
ncbi:iron-sulfur cluster biosynthesis family protein [Alicyclobacillus dauci]|uniref:Core domain-containing protein n=1 Tax=Alicyclobacillus dauci TaxID=1475485 RepID=A0ABY6Z5D0_9BACL|nr:iron-sulfur cluster biosynthesis family protein [Alicyclobacillus dauci]WAH38071.1 hypothetical protein NZD86_06170 [Alicyclobacillus dauci]